MPASRWARKLTHSPFRASGVWMVALVVGCSSPADELAYQEVRSTLSLEKLRAFYQDFPDSPLGIELATEALQWCRTAPGLDCYEILAESIPVGHPQHAEVIARRDAFLDDASRADVSTSDSDGETP